MSLFKATEDSEMWKDYVEYLDDLVLDGFFEAVHTSLQYLLQETDASKEELLPLNEVKLELQSPEMVFSPSLDQDNPDGFFILMETLVDDIFRVATLVPRIAKHSEQENYGVSGVHTYVHVYYTYVCTYCIFGCFVNSH